MKIAQEVFLHRSLSVYQFILLTVHNAMEGCFIAYNIEYSNVGTYMR